MDINSIISQKQYISDVTLEGRHNNVINLGSRDTRPYIVIRNNEGLSVEDFGGKGLEGCNENLVITSPENVKEVHKRFLESGCDVIETNTFGANSIVLDEYSIANKSYEINC